MSQEDEKKAAEAAGVKAEPAARSGTPEKPAQQEAAKPDGVKAEAKDSAEQTLRRELEETKKKLEETEKALAAQKDTFLRTAAEYDNYRKRTSREKESAYSDATADAVKEFLGVEDNLERALAQKECSAEDLRKGVEMTEKQMRDALKKLGVSEMEADGKTFDPMLHSAVAHIEDEKLGENIVAQVFQKGYLLNGKVIRHAIVQTAN